MTTDEQEKFDLLNRRDKLTLDKREKENLLNEIRLRIRSSGRMQDGIYKNLCHQQKILARDILHLERELSQIKVGLRKFSVEKNHDFFKRGEVERLVSLREEYKEFAADPTRSPTMRTMAAEFVLKLDPIIRTSVKNNNGNTDPELEDR